MKGMVHCHSENSRYDSPMDVTTICKKAKELGYEAVALTDHGTLTGIDDFVKAAKEIGIKPIPGVEAYMQEDNSDEKRLHLLLLAKDDLGYQGIGKAVTRSNKRIDSYGYPRMNREILRELFGPDSIYHGHVIATSACVGGVLAGILLSPLNHQKEIAKLMIKQEKYEKPFNVSYLTNRKRLKEFEKRVLELTEVKDQCMTLSKKPYKKKEKELEKLKKTATKEEYETAAEALKKEKEESETAAKVLEEVRAKISLTKKSCTQLKTKLKESEVSQEKYLQLEKEIEEMKKKIIPIEVLYEDAKNMALWYQETFGKENFYVEMQYHGYRSDDGKIDMEEAVFKKLAELADELNIPIAAANDAHIADNSDASIRARQMICSLSPMFSKSNRVADVREGDRELYMKSEEELRRALYHVLTPEKVEEAIENTYKICEACNCEFKNGSHYPKFLGLKNETADDALRRMAYAGIKKRYPNEEAFNETYQKRLEYELSVIAEMGYSDYFLIVQDFLEFGRKLGHLSDEAVVTLRENIKSLSLKELVNYVDNHQTEVGFSIGAGRGSAAGSLVAYLIGITNIIDPIEYDLLFERFLNKDRVSMPDVDSDLSPDIRDLVVEYCKKLYGVETVANIVTKGYMAPRGAIRNAARILGIEKDKRDYYLGLAGKLSKLVPLKPGISFADCEADIRNFITNGKTEIANPEMKKDEIEIIDQAKLIEGVFLNYGMHAAGVIIADGKPIDNYVPLMKDDVSGDMKVQCDMVQAEETHGLLKFDFLGLRNLKIVTMTLREIRKSTGKVIDIEQLPFEKEVFEHIFSAGKTGSVFQFESPGMKKMLKSFKPDCFEDLVALVSLYRPGPMDFIPQYIEAKFHPETISYLCPQLEPILSKTYGCIVYQEQVMEIVQKLAGFSLSQADNVRRFMSKKKMDKLEHEREAFVHGEAERGIDGCESRGISAAVANKLFDQMIEFAKYAFNKSHAAAYAALSYITAYLKYHYPAEYMCSVLNCTDNAQKMPSVLGDCREIGIEVLPPDINSSDIGFIVKENKILFGLNSIKGTKIAAVRTILEDRKINGEYISFKDFLKRKVGDKSTCEGLIYAGAMDAFHPNRYAMLRTYEVGNELVGKIKDKEEDLQDKEEKLREKPEEKRTITAYQKAKDALELLKQQFEVLRIIDGAEDKKQRMLKEKEVLGFFVTSHPMESFRLPEQMGCVSISNLEPGAKPVEIIGIIENLEIKGRKKDNKPMAFFDLEDLSGMVHVCCFTESYQQFGEYLEENQTVKLFGMVNQEVDELSGDAEISFFVESVKILKPDLNEITLFLSDISQWNENLNEIRKKKLIQPDGHPLLVYDKLMGEYRHTSFYVSKEILKDETFETRQ